LKKGEFAEVEQTWGPAVCRLVGILQASGMTAVRWEGGTDQGHDLTVQK
jgi:hypothetical protein